MKNCDDFEQIHLHCILLKILNYLDCFKNICDLIFKSFIIKNTLVFVTEEVMKMLLVF